MRKEYTYIIMIILAAITIYGLVTGRFLFLFLLIPFGFGLFNKKNGDEDEHP